MLLHLLSTSSLHCLAWTTRRWIIVCPMSTALVQPCVIIIPVSCVPSRDGDTASLICIAVAPVSVHAISLSNPLPKCWPNVSDVGPTFDKVLASVLCVERKVIASIPLVCDTSRQSPATVLTLCSPDPRGLNHSIHLLHSGSRSHEYQFVNLM